MNSNISSQPPFSDILDKREENDGIDEVKNEDLTSGKN